MLSLSPPRGSRTNYSALQSKEAKKFVRLALASGANQRLHVIEITLQSAPARRGQTIFGFRQTSVEGLGADDVVGFFELTSVHAEVAVGRLEHGLQFVEGQRAVNRESADDAKADTLVDQAIEIGRESLGRLRRCSGQRGFAVSGALEALVSGC